MSSRIKSNLIQPSRSGAVGSVYVAAINYDVLPLLQLFQPTVDNQHDLKVVWIDDMLDDDYSGVRLAAK